MKQIWNLLCYHGWTFFITHACNFWEWCTCTGPYDEKHNLCRGRTEPVWLCMQMWCSSRLEGTFGLVYLPVLLENSCSSLATSVYWLAVLVIYGKKDQVIYVLRQCQLSSLKCFWSPCSLVRRHVDSCSDTIQFKYSFQKVCADCFITNCQKRGSVFVCLLQEFAPIGWPALPTPWLPPWMVMNAGAAYIMVGLARSPAEKDEKKALLFVWSSAITKSCISCLIS